MKKIIVALFALLCTFLLYINLNKNVTHIKNEDSKAKVSSKVSVKYTKSSSNSSSTIYSIKGKSDNITGKNLTLMNESRESNKAMAVKYPGKVFINGNTMKKQVALTFDDGIDPVITPDILKILKENNVKASFFVIGSTVIKNSSIVKKAYNDGNLILNHSYSHIELTKAKDQVIKDEIVKTEDAIYSVIGEKPDIIRPPYGEIDDNLIKIETELGYKASVLWSTDTLDWSQKEPDNIVNNVIDNVRPGEIILMHTNEDKSATVAALPIIIKKLKAMGYEIVTLDKILNVQPYR
ncbi:polysaccharide deacetylase family protein [Clostridium sp. JN-9]|uniref:polysaccharide deacetylase family protein n=1 Tax=Clostridium sp. JN-9 TaxID=2507159 RepID=UPI000FFE1600|nr:polysaccharide deacetylase family protein [Clostridium sp. JN-9]QAT40881.1 polysaccharide deacetylase family protein [Clostridium sp. JN-9]